MSPSLELVKPLNGKQFLRYKEDLSKSNQAGLKQRKLKKLFSMLMMRILLVVLYACIHFINSLCPPILLNTSCSS